MDYVEIDGRKFPKVRQILSLKNGNSAPVLCPFCDNYHWHGLGEGNGHVNITCNGRKFIKADDGIVLYRESGYYIIE